MNILVVCTGNYALSLLLEVILRRHGGGALNVYSAGSRPALKPHRETLRFLADKGYDVSGLSSKSWNTYSGIKAPVMDVVIAVCIEAASRASPRWPGSPLRAHWGIEKDPVEAEDIPAAFRAAYDTLDRRATALFQEDIRAMDLATLQAHLTACSTIE